ncbi:MAG: DUF721 domain-containing protein [Bacteroidales bacterium]|nr:DUF721 domain-containing protein [Bacteroidales bacterium]
MFLKKEYGIRMEKKKPDPVASVVPVYLRAMRLTSGMNTRRIFKAWEEASGAAEHTLRQFFRAGTLYVTLDSSVIRSRLSYETDLIKEKINAILREDPLFTGSDRFVGLVEKIVLK